MQNFACPSGAPGQSPHLHAHQSNANILLGQSYYYWLHSSSNNLNHIYVIYRPKYTLYNIYYQSSNVPSAGLYSYHTWLQLISFSGRTIYTLMLHIPCVILECGFGVHNLHMNDLTELVWWIEKSFEYISNCGIFEQKMCIVDIIVEMCFACKFGICVVQYAWRWWRWWLWWCW